MNLFQRFQSFQNLLPVTIEKSKQKLYSQISNKLMDSVTSRKTYWSILKVFLNNKKYLSVRQFVIIIITLQIAKRKLRFLTISLLNSALLSTILANFQLILLKEEITVFLQISCIKDDIAEIIKNLDLNKVHGHMISICMLKICGASF